MNWARLRQTIRSLGREPGFAVVAILILALGIGSSTTMFSVMHAVLLAPVPGADPARVVALGTRWTDSGRKTARLPGGDWMDIANARDVFEAVGRYAGGEVGVQLRDRAEWAGTYWVSPEFLRVFDAKPLAGREISVGDVQKSAVVGAAFARRAFGDPGRAIGQVIRVEARPYEVVGVMPDEFRFPGKADVWIADKALPDNKNRSAYNYYSVARLRPGVTVDAATARLEALGNQLAAAYPENKNKLFTATPVRDAMSQRVRSTVILLASAVGLLLLISCANVAHLSLARSARRTREFAVRAALGADGARIVSESFLESLLIGVGGAALGIALAFAGIAAVQWLAPQNLPRIDEARPSWLVLAFGIALSILASLVAGLAPAWQTLRTDVQQGLRASAGRGLVGGSARLRAALVACEIALSFTLAAGAGLLIRSFVELNSTVLGFRTEGLLVAYAHAPAATLAEARGATRFFERSLDELRQLPGVTSAAAVMGLPTGRYSSNGSYGTEAEPMTEAAIAKLPNAGFRLASKDYFTTLGVPLLAGRDFDDRDQYDAPFVAIVSSSLAKRSFPNENPIGKKIMCGFDSDKWMTIVGVVGEVRTYGAEQAPGPELYMPFQQHPFGANELQVVVRTPGKPEALADVVVGKLRSLNPEVAVKTTTLRAMVSDSMATPRFRTFLVGTFAGIALLLALAGVYGVMSYLVAQRAPELGLRMALGSSPAGVMRLVVRSAAVMAGIGLVAGVGLSAAAARLMESLLFGVKTSDPAGLVAAGVAIGLVTLGAAALPAWRAARIDPGIALRDDAGG